MLARIALLLPLGLLPWLVLAQTPVPPEVDRALHARVAEFLQYHVDGNFRKAYEMVAADTQDDYFNTGKVQIKGFTIDAVTYSDNFTKAAVTATMSRMMNVAGADFPVTMPSVTTWKIENGKWVWYKNVVHSTDTPFGPFALPAAAGAKPLENTEVALPKDFSDKTIADAARSILQQVSVDRNDVVLATDKASEEKVVLHNGMTGSVKVEVTAPEIPGFTATVEQPTIRAAGDLAVLLRYEPGDHTAPKEPVSVQLTVQPINQSFRIRVNFAGPAPK